MTISKPRYKKAFSFEAAEEMIIDKKNSTYNSDLIEAFMALKYEFREISG